MPTRTIRPDGLVQVTHEDGTSFAVPPHLAGGDDMSGVADWARQQPAQPPQQGAPEAIESYLRQMDQPPQDNTHEARGATQRFDALDSVKPDRANPNDLVPAGGDQSAKVWAAQAGGAATPQQYADVDPAVQQYSDYLSRGSYVAPRQAGWTPQGRTAEYREQDPELKERLQKASLDRVEAAGVAAEAEKAAAEAQRSAAETALYQQQDALDGERAKRAELDTRVNELRRQRDLSMREAAQVGQIDPGRYMREDGFARFLSSLGMLMTITGVKGGPEILSYLQGAVRDDIEAQKASAQLAMQRGQRADNAYQDALDRYGDPILAEKDLQLRQLKVGEQILMNQAQKATNEASFQRAQAGLAELAAAQEQALVEWEQAAAPVVRESMAYDRGSRGGYSQLDPLTRAKKLAEFKGAIDKIKGTPTGEEAQKALERSVRLPGSDENVYAAAADDAKKARAFYQNASKFNTTLNRFESALDRFGRSADPESRAELTALATDLQLTYKNLTESGALDKGLQEIMGKVIPDPGETMTLDASQRGKIQALRSAMSTQDRAIRHGLNRRPDMPSSGWVSGPQYQGGRVVE